MLGGRPLIDRAMEQARRWSDVVAIAVRERAQLPEARRRFSSTIRRWRARSARLRR